MNAFTASVLALFGAAVAGIAASATADDEQKHPTTVRRTHAAESTSGGAAGGEPTTTLVGPDETVCSVVFGVQRAPGMKTVDVGLHYEKANGRFAGIEENVACTSTGPFGFTSFFDVLDEQARFISAFFDDRSFASSSSTSTSTSTSTSSSSSSTTTTTSTTLMPALDDDGGNTPRVAAAPHRGQRAARLVAARATGAAAARTSGGSAGDPSLLELATCQFVAPDSDLPTADDFDLEVFFAKDKQGDDIVPVPAGAVISVSCEGVTTTTVPGAACGDPNDDGNFTATDALFVLRAAVGSLACALSVCDVGGNGSITASDALHVLRVAVGLLDESTLDCAG